MARLRARRAFGYRCLTIEFHPADVDALVRRGFLDRLCRDEEGAVERAVESLLESL